MTEQLEGFTLLDNVGLAIEVPEPGLLPAGSSNSVSRERQIVCTIAAAARHSQLTDRDLSKLSPNARLLANTLSGLSHALWNERWREGVEHEVWEASHVPGSALSSVSLGAEINGSLRDLSMQAGGWIGWADAPVFLLHGAWAGLHRVWVRRREGTRDRAR